MALTILLLGLGGCAGRQDAQRFAAWRQEMQAGTVEFQAELTAVSGQRQTGYTARCRHAGGETEIRLTAPATLAGVTVRQREDGGELEYDGAILELGSVGSGGRSPCGALPALLEGLKNGRLLSLGREDGCVTAELELSDGETVRFWLSEESLIPCRAELLEEGRSVVLCEIQDWKMGET